MWCSKWTDYENLIVCTFRFSIQGLPGLSLVSTGMLLRITLQPQKWFCEVGMLQDHLSGTHTCVPYTLLSHWLHLLCTNCHSAAAALPLHVSMVVWWWYCNCRNNDLPHTAYKKSQAHRFFHNDRTYFIYRNRKYIYCECYTFQSWLFLNPFIQCFDSAHVAIDVMLWSMYCQTCYNKYDNSPLC